MSLSIYLVFLIPLISSSIFEEVGCLERHDAGSGEIGSADVLPRAFYQWKNARLDDPCSKVSCFSTQTCDTYTWSDVVYPICHTPTKGCTSTSCENGGTCEGNRCYCPANFHGSKCETGGTPCASQPCQNGGTCITIPGGGYRCQCMDGFSGSRCLDYSSTFPPAPISSVCIENDCLGDNCRCVPSCKHEQGFYCISDTGYIGKHCDIGPPKLTCGNTSVLLIIPFAFAMEYGQGDSSSVHLYVATAVDEKNPEQCTAKLRRGTDSFFYEANFSFSQCGNLVASTDTEVVYQNTLWINRNIGNDLYDMPSAVLDFSCKYKTDYTITTSMKPVVDRVVPKISSLRQLKASVALCKISTCRESCPQGLVVTKGATYTVSEIIHLTLKLESYYLHPSFHGNVSEVFLSCSSDNADSMTKLSLMSRCYRNEYLEANLLRIDRAAFCFSFRVPRALPCREMYIHIRFSACSKYTPATCPDGRRYFACDRLRKRSLIDDGELQHSIGPIVIVDFSKPGVDTISIKSDAGSSVTFGSHRQPSNSSAPVIHSSESNWSLLLISGVVFVIFSVVSFLSVQAVKRSRQI